MKQLIQHWQRLNPRQRLVAIALGGLLGLFALDALALRPLRIKIRALRKEINQTKQLLSESVAASAQAGSVNIAFGEYEKHAKASGSNESEIAALLSEVEAALRESGMFVLSLKPASSKAGTDESVSVSVDAESSPTQLVQFLDIVSRSSRLLRATELNSRVSESKTLRSSIIISKLLLR